MVYDVVVVGAGMAGLAAARVCAEAGLKAVVLEASARVGGRVRTLRVGREVVELGAEFVHGQPTELVALIAEAGLTTYERTGAFLRLGDDGLAEEEDDGDGVLEGLKSYAGEDCSFAAYVDRLGLAEWERDAEIGYVEGFNAADAREASVVALGRQQVAEDAIDGGRNWRVVEGYDRLPEFVAERVRAAGGEIVFGAQVEEVAWGEWGVEMRCADGRRVRARRGVIALPLGLLQSRGPGMHAPRFVPEPERVFAAMAKMRMGDAFRMTLVFRERIWPEGMSFLLTPELTPGVWWTAHPAESLTLTGWIGGPRAKQFVCGAKEQAAGRVVSAVSSAFGLSEEQVRGALVSTHTHDWGCDQLALGAYSWVSVDGADASAQMAEPVEERLYFAGEHTDVTGHWGTVHGALRSGLRAGRQVVAGFEDGS